jgi:hypothetical protein
MRSSSWYDRARAHGAGRVRRWRGGPRRVLVQTNAINSANKDVDPYPGRNTSELLPLCGRYYSGSWTGTLVAWVPYGGQLTRFAGRLHQSPARAVAKLGPWHVYG